MVDWMNEKRDTVRMAYTVEETFDHASVVVSLEPQLSFNVYRRTHTWFLMDATQSNQTTVAATGHIVMVPMYARPWSVVWGSEANFSHITNIEWTDQEKNWLMCFSIFSLAGTPTYWIVCNFWSAAAIGITLKSDGGTAHTRTRRVHIATFGTLFPVQGGVLWKRTWITLHWLADKMFAHL